MLDLNGQKLVSLADASKILPGNPHVSTLHRWRLRGVRGVKLPTVLIGGRRFVDRQSLAEFVAAVTAAAAGKPPPIRTAKQHQRAVAQAERELTEAGIVTAEISDPTRKRA